MGILEHTGHPGLHIEPGQVVSILGAPASGKTRLGLELAFLQRPRSGEVRFHGVNPLAKRGLLGATHRPHEVTILVQNAEDQLFARTVFDDVAFGPRRRGWSPDVIERRVEDALRAVQLDFEEIRDRSPFALSGGERRRVALAGVLAMQPEVLILDEPTANLDPRTRHDFVDLLEPLRGKGAVVWLTSSAREAASADRIYLLQNGATTAVESGAHMFHDWRALEEAGIELPGIYELAGALERRGMHLPPAGSPDEVREALVQELRERRHDR